MKLKYLFLVAFIFLISMNILLIFQNKKNIKNNKLLFRQTSELNETVSNKVIILEQNILLSLTSENLSIKKDTLLSTNKELLTFDKIIRDHPKLFLRYSELNCQTCVDVQLVSLKELAIEIKPNNIIILAKYNNIANLIRFKRINKLQFKIYNVDSLNIPLEKENVPYYFISDRDLKTRLVFVPRKELPSLTDKYFEIVKRSIVK